MLLTITTTHSPATDLGYLLHKHPERRQSFSLTFGEGHVFYPEAGPERCTAALLLDIDPVGLVRGKSAAVNREKTLDHYVNDRPYAASSFLSVAISRIFGTALSGRCKDRPELADTPIPLTVSLPVLPCRGEESFLRQLFEPLGYQMEGRSLPLDPTFPDWQNSVYRAVTLENTVRLADLLSHLYVLIPVLDDDKHYWVGDEEIEKLLRHGEGWLRVHPLRDKIAQRYLKRRRRLARIALAQLAEENEPDPDAAEMAYAEEEATIENPISLNQQRLETVAQALKTHQAKRVIDLGCGEGRLLRSLLKDKAFDQLTGVDVSYRALEIAKERLRLDRLPAHQQGRVQLMQGSLIYRDERLRGYDAATVVEVIEHLDPDRLAAFERVVFEIAQPPAVIVTTPNIEYNVRFETLPAGKLRHRDHRFEWTRAEFQTWATGVAQRFEYAVQFQPIGPDDPDVGSPTQMGIFTQR